MKKSHLALLVGLAAVFVWSGINPYDRLTWWLEVFPGIFGLIVLAATYRRFQFTMLVYTLIALHISICLAVSATYEFIEWWSALIGGAASTEFLGTQGDVWDTQEDMFMCLVGAVCSLVFMSKWQDRQLRRLSSS